MSPYKMSSNTCSSNLKRYIRIFPLLVKSIVFSFILWLKLHQTFCIKHQRMRVMAVQIYKQTILPILDYGVSFHFRYVKNEGVIYRLFSMIFLEYVILPGLVIWCLFVSCIRKHIYSV